MALTDKQRQEARQEISSAGGKARAAKLTPEQRSAAARRAINARWSKSPRKPK